MALRTVCGDTSVIDYDNIIGSGTHGTVYGSYISNNIAVKVFPITKINKPTCYGVQQSFNSCDVIRNGEYSYQETAREYLNDSKSVIDADIVNIVDIPDVYGFKFLPTASQAKCCSYLMKRLHPIGQHLIQLSFNYERDHDSILSSGRYVGIDTFKQLGFSEYDFSKVNRSIATVFAVLHYGMKTDAYDIEFILAANGNKEDGQYIVYALDFDKFSSYNESYPYCVSRKLTESDYDHRTISDETRLARLLATTINYCPDPSYPEYIEWKDTYIRIATLYNRNNLAIQVLKIHESLST